MSEQIVKFHTIEDFRKYCQIFLDNKLHLTWGAAKPLFEKWITSSFYSYKPRQGVALIIDGEYIGWVIDVLNTKNHIETWAYVKREHRRKGYGSKLVKAIKGAKKVHLEGGNIYFWERVGYRREAPPIIRV